MIVAACGLLMSGCASVAANEKGGIVEGASGARNAMAKAEAHCAKFDKTAKSTSYDAFWQSITFECVAK